jgi:hypothetical protein
MDETKELKRRAAMDETKAELKRRAAMDETKELECRSTG